MSDIDDILTSLENAVEHDIRSRMTGSILEDLLPYCLRWWHWSKSE